MNSIDLKKNLSQFKKNILLKHDYWVYEQNGFDRFLDNSFNLIKKILLIIDNNIKLRKNLKTFIIMIKNSIIKILDKLFNSNELIQKSNILNKKIDDQQKFIEQNIKDNIEIKNDINKINSSLNKIFQNPNKLLHNEVSNSSGHNSIARVDFYQEENVRLGSELLETKKKFDILKSELEKYEEQRSNLISKINSVNDAIKDTNVLTNVFENSVKPKIDVVDHNKLKIKRKDKVDINEQVKNIFNK